MTKNKIVGFEKWFKKPIQIKAKRMCDSFSVETLEGTMKGKAGDYLITGVKGEQYPCDKEIFEMTYSKEKSIPVLVHEKYKEKVTFSVIREINDLIEWGTQEQAENNIYRKSVDELNGDWIEKIKKLKQKGGFK